MNENKKHKKFIFITGGVASSLGKGLAAASIAGLLLTTDCSINEIKEDKPAMPHPGGMDMGM